MWKIITYSNVKYPLPPYTQQYCIGIAENTNEERKVVHIDKEYQEEIYVGTCGDIEEHNELGEIISYFLPNNYKRKEQKKKVAVITGSSRGIGRAIAIELAKQKYAVVINSSSTSEEGINTVNKIIEEGGEAIYIQANISNGSEVKQMIEKVEQMYNHIDVLVNNAGITMDKRFEHMTVEQWNKVLDVNLTSVFHCTQAVIKIMQKQGYGKIINISSIVGETGNSGQANYAATKGAIIAFTKTLAKEYAKDSITVNAIAPGFITTKMTEKMPKGIIATMNQQIPLGRFGTPEEVAKVAAFLASEDARYITGQVIRVNGGLYM